LQKLLWRLSVSPFGTPRAAVDLTARAEALFERTGRRLTIGSISGLPGNFCWSHVLTADGRDA
jgi:hypothetical protein